MELQRQFLQSNVAAYPERSSNNDISALRHVAVEAIEIVCNIAEQSHATSLGYASMIEAPPMMIISDMAIEAPSPPPPPFRIDEHSDILLEVMSFLYPAEWGTISLLCRSVAAKVATVSETLVQAYLPAHLIATATTATTATATTATAARATAARATATAARATATVQSSKAMTEEPKPYTLDEFRTSSSCSDDINGKSVIATYHQVAASAATTAAGVLTPVAGAAELFSWGPNMRTYIGLISMDISGVWRVNGSYTNGDKYCYTMKLNQIGPRRGGAKLEAYVEGEVQLSETEFILIGGKVDGTIAVFHEILLNNINNINNNNNNSENNGDNNHHHSSSSSSFIINNRLIPPPQRSNSNSNSNRVANVVSGILNVDGRFMSGAWLQHDCTLLRMFPSISYSAANHNSRSNEGLLLTESYNNNNHDRLLLLQQQQQPNNNNNNSNHHHHHHNDHQHPYPLMILSSGIFRAIKLLLLS